MIVLNRYRKTLAKIQHDKEHFNYKNSTKKKPANIILNDEKQYECAFSLRLGPRQGFFLSPNPHSIILNDLINAIRQ